MASRASTAALIAVGLDRRADEPLQSQLYRQIREAVLAGRLPPGSRLPASRSLAGELHCSRNTVVGAYDQLFSEGYLEGRTGAGTYISKVLPEELLAAAVAARAKPKPRPTAPRLSARGRAFTGPAAVRTPHHRAFALGLPELATFPFELWSRLLARTWRRPDPALLSRGHPAGWPALRRAIAGYLRAVRAVDCEADQVFITSGAQQAVDLVVRVLLDPGDQVWLEEPGYRGLRGVLLANQAQIVPLSVDAEGLSVAAGRAQAPRARLAVVAPSHQYPLGVTMSLGRRLELLDWARGADAWILEDDYDSEYRYAGRPLAALQGLDAQDGDGRVLYVGSFSKVLFPSLRLGYLIVPQALVDSFARARAAVDDHPSTLVQPALASFIEEGHFAAHVRRMRSLYAGRQAALISALRDQMADLLDVAPDDAGMHLVARPTAALAARMTDHQAAECAARADITVAPLSGFYMGPPADQGLLLGYAALNEAEIGRAVGRLRQVLRD